MREEMNNHNLKIVVGNPAKSGNVREFIVGLGTYQPGWKWSSHVGVQTGKTSENHIGYIISGRMMVQDSGGAETEVGPGEAFEIGSGHDAWAIGETPCIALDFSPIDHNSHP